MPAVESPLSGRPAALTPIAAFREVCGAHAFYARDCADGAHIASVARRAVRACAERPALAEQARAHALRFNQERWAQGVRRLYLERFARADSAPASRA